jgi:hypothetical protein
MLQRHCHPVRPLGFAHIGKTATFAFASRARSAQFEPTRPMQSLAGSAPSMIASAVNSQPRFAPFNQRMPLLSRHQPSCLLAVPHPSTNRRPPDPQPDPRHNAPPGCPFLRAQLLSTNRPVLHPRRRRVSYRSLRVSFAGAACGCKQAHRTPIDCFPSRSGLKLQPPRRICWNGRRSTSRTRCAASSTLRVRTPQIRLMPERSRLPV